MSKGFGSDEEGEHTNLLQINATLLTNDHCADNMTKTFELERAKEDALIQKLDADLRVRILLVTKNYQIHTLWLFLT